MAIFYAQFQVVKRSAGRSVVAAVAYRSGERLTDERTQEIHDYTRRSGVDDKFIMTPEHAPAWASDRAQLWSAVETGETRINSQLAREVVLALPAELSKDQSRALLKEYVQESFVDKGMIADVAVHDAKSHNPHAHVVMTMREISPEGFTVKNRDWNDRGQLKDWREGWAHKVNKHLEIHGHEERIDHRSLQEQGIKQKPTTHLGPYLSGLEKQGIRTLAGDHNRGVKEDNQELKDIPVAMAELDRVEKKLLAVIQNPPRYKATEEDSRTAEAFFLKSMKARGEFTELTPPSSTPKVEPEPKLEPKSPKHSGPKI